jgi:nucleoside-diphosphate-sugar epimerase
MRVLITGATGFVGSHVLEAMMGDESITPIAACRDRLRLVDGFDGEVREGNLLDEGYLRDVVKGVDVIFHAAAWTSLWNHSGQSERLFLQPSLSLIQAAKAAGVSRFLATFMQCHCDRECA